MDLHAILATTPPTMTSNAGWPGCWSTTDGGSAARPPALMCTMSSRWIAPWTSTRRRTGNCWPKAQAPARWYRAKQSSALESVLDLTRIRRVVSAGHDPGGPAPAGRAARRGLCAPAPALVHDLGLDRPAHDQLLRR